MNLKLPSADGCSGNQTYTVLPKCTCGDGAYVHALDKKTRRRTACSAWFGSKCSCVVYQARSDTDG